MSTEQTDIVQAILGSKPIAYRADFAKISGSVTAGVMLSQAYYWHDKSTKHDDGWFEKTGAEWHDETGLTDKQQQTARFILAKKGFMESERKGDRGRMCSRVNHANVYAALVALYSADRQNRDSGQIGKMDKLHRQNGQSKIGKKANLSYNRLPTENTAENTASAALWMPKNKVVKTETKKRSLKKVDLTSIQKVIDILKPSEPFIEKAISDETKYLIESAIENDGLDFVLKAVQGRAIQAEQKANTSGEPKDLMLRAFFSHDKGDWRVKCHRIGERQQNASEGLQMPFKSTLPDFSHIKYDDAPIDEEAWQTLTGSKN